MTFSEVSNLKPLQIFLFSFAVITWISYGCYSHYIFFVTIFPMYLLLCTFLYQVMHTCVEKESLCLFIYLFPDAFICYIIICIMCPCRVSPPHYLSPFLPNPFTPPLPFPPLPFPYSWVSGVQFSLWPSRPSFLPSVIPFLCLPFLSYAFPALVPHFCPISIQLSFFSFFFLPTLYPSLVSHTHTHPYLSSLTLPHLQPQLP